jgi:hypothetical protein
VPLEFGEKILANSYDHGAKSLGNKAYLNCDVTRMTTKESSDVLVLVFRASDVMVLFRCSAHAFLVCLGQHWVFLLEKTHAVLATLNLSDLLLEGLAICTTVSGFR